MILLSGFLTCVDVCSFTGITAQVNTLHLGPWGLLSEGHTTADISVFLSLSYCHCQSLCFSLSHLFRFPPLSLFTLHYYTQISQNNTFYHLSLFSILYVWHSLSVSLFLQQASSIFHVFSVKNNFNLKEFVDPIRAANSSDNKTFFTLCPAFCLFHSLMLSRMSQSFSLRVMTGSYLPLRWRWGRWAQWMEGSTPAWPSTPLWSHSTRNAPSASLCCLVRQYFRSTWTGTESRAVVSLFLCLKTVWAFFLNVGKFSCQHSKNIMFHFLFNRPILTLRCDQRGQVFRWNCVIGSIMQKCSFLRMKPLKPYISEKSNFSWTYLYIEMRKKSKAAL